MSTSTCRLQSSDFINQLGSDIRIKWNQGELLAERVRQDIPLTSSVQD